MANSLSQTVELTCPECEETFQADVWLIVDTAEEPEVVDAIKQGTLNQVTCPQCGEELGMVDTPLLIYQPGESSPLIFSPAQRTEREQDQEQATGLLRELRTSLGEEWQDEWLEGGLSMVPRRALPTALTEGLEAAQAQLQAQAEDVPELHQTLIAFLQAETWAQSKAVVEEHPELLEEEVDDLIERLIAAAQQQEDENAEQAFREHRQLLQRAREVGVEEAFGERIQATEGLSSQLVLGLLLNFVEAETWPEAQAFVEEHPELLTDEADVMMDKLIAATREEGQPELVEMLQEHKALLQRCREVGVEQAFAAKIEEA